MALAVVVRLARQVGGSHVTDSGHSGRGAGQGLVLLSMVVVLVLLLAWLAVVHHDDDDDAVVSR